MFEIKRLRGFFVPQGFQRLDWFKVCNLCWHYRILLYWFATHSFSVFEQLCDLCWFVKHANCFVFYVYGWVVCDLSMAHVGNDINTCLSISDDSFWTIFTSITVFGDRLASYIWLQDLAHGDVRVFLGEEQPLCSFVCSFKYALIVWFQWSCHD